VAVQKKAISNIEMKARSLKVSTTAPNEIKSKQVKRRRRRHIRRGKTFNINVVRPFCDWKVAVNMASIPI
jgi:hypothetical protein